MIAQLLWDCLWQGAAIFGLTYLATRFVSDRNATTRYALWFAALLAMVVVPLATQFSTLGSSLAQWLFAGTNHGGSVTISLTAIDRLSHDVDSTAPALWGWVEAVWIIGVGIQLTRFLVSFVRVIALRRQATAMPEYGDDVMASEAVQIPIAAGFVSPRVILPRTLSTSLSRDDLATIVAHERAHIQRGDIYGNLVQRAIETILWFNPFVHVVGHHLVRERESACDDWAVRDRVATDYAACLAEIATRSVRGGPLLTPSVLGSDSTLLKRVRRLMRGGPVRLSLNYYTLGGIVITFALLTLAVQALNPIASSAAPASTGTYQAPTTLVAASCSIPDQLAAVTKPVAPNPPSDMKPGFVDLLVAVDANGHPSKIMIQKTTKALPTDQVLSVLHAAQKSTYSSATRNCVPVSGTYVFHAEFSPDH